MVDWKGGGFGILHTLRDGDSWLFTVPDWLVIGLLLLWPGLRFGRRWRINHRLNKL
jgi:hypothetical protein